MPRLQQKRGTDANLTSVDPTPLAGELLVVTDENTLVIGNGTDSYTSLAYVTATPRSHTHLFSAISDIAFADPLADNSIVVYSAGVGWVTASTIGLIGVGSQPLGGWPSGSIGAAFAGKAAATHASSHATGGSDALSPSDIGAAPAASPTFSGVVTASIGSVGGSLTQSPSETSGESIRLVSSATAGTGNYGAQIAWSRLGDGNGRRAAIGSVQTAADNDQVGLAFFAHADASATVEMYEAMRLTHAGLVGIATTSPTATLDIDADTMRLRTARTPASASATGNAGDICWDASYLYICTATNTWRRIAHSTW